MVILATMATVIASQALISGAFSLTRQGIALGLFPRVQIVFTSTQIEGQIYIPAVNWMLMAGCTLLVVGFKSSSALAAAYGIAVTGTMAITSFIFYFVARGWGWPQYPGGAAVPALSDDRSFLFLGQPAEVRRRRLHPDRHRLLHLLPDGDLEVESDAARPGLREFSAAPAEALYRLEAEAHRES